MEKSRISEFTVCLDRVEDRVAVLLAPSGHLWHLSADRLPAGAREGMMLAVTLRTDPDSTDEALERIRRLREGLTGN